MELLEMGDCCYMEDDTVSPAHLPQFSDVPSSAKPLRVSCPR